ncbi:radical SAM family heme chaperone HemW [Novipirellula artificiosorum]|uniref:Heme chaperone HemW n=1 Tax=Novipirellula artificiosorum TaxID=2528016 RepID=A0A5C6D7M5_9BACT|nr:radical SAM family heme chaperone HemW [Novipirellula artificiosorum]TWU32820.1 Oxygen-independent coproporphyrinogen-III oxidase-like protein [Novipirellula artificiosorum]
MTIPDRDWPIPRSAYVHVPFCRHRCGYCNFSVIAGREDLIDRFLDAIDRELAPLDRPVVDTLYLGGGTPTHLPNDRLARLLEILQRRFRFDDAVEWTSEANPEDVDTEKLRVLSEYGVNRISLGVQSFQTAKLKRFERNHSATQATRAVEQAAEVIGNVSIDLIFAAPGETLRDWQADLRTVLDLPVQHLSAYALTFEKGTPFWNARMHGQIKSVSETTEIKMYESTRHLTAESGMAQYEISNFALPGFHSRHNMAYWLGRGWFAAGPGAARFSEGRREVNHRSTTTYLNRMERGESPVAETETLTQRQSARERAAFGVRMIDGIDLTEIGRDTGVNLWSECAAEIEQAITVGWLERSEDRIRLTPSGLLFADAVAAELLP